MAVYFIQSLDNGFIKIGKAKNVVKRFGELTRETEKQLKLLATIQGYSDEETILHKRFAHIRVEREWFKPTRELIEFISQCEDISFELGPLDIIITKRKKVTKSTVIDTLLNYHALGYFIRTWRESNNIDQMTLAKKADISKSYLSVIENNEAHNLSVDVLVGLARAMEMEPEGLLRVLRNERKSDTDQGHLKRIL